MSIMKLSMKGTSFIKEKQIRPGNVILLLLIQTAFLLIFSYMTSPLFPYAHGWDSAFFQHVGAGMTKGYLPYRDFFDMKGPWLFLIEWFGQLFIYGRTGVFLMQYINMGVVLFLCYRIHEQFFEGAGIWRKLIALIPFFLILAPTMEGGNNTEEWSLSFLFLSLYLALDYIIGDKKEHRPTCAFIYGCCFGVLSLIRIINAVLICAIVLTITISLLMEKKWKNFAYNALAFIAGVIAAFIPPLLYFGYYGEIKDMLYCTFVFGFIYGTEGEGFGFGTGALYLFTLLFLIISFIISGVKNRRMWILAVAYSAGMFVTLQMGNSTMHDYMLIIPGVMLGVWQLMAAFAGQKMTLGRKRIAVIALLICFAYPCYKMLGVCKEMIHQTSDTTNYDSVTDIASYIPEEDYDSVWGYVVHLRFYSITDIIPYSKYCGWQEHYMELSPQIEEEIMQMLREAPPKWIVVRTSIEIENQKVKSVIENEYEVYHVNSMYTLYRNITE